MRDAQRLLDEATALQGAGCFAVVLEAMPAIVAARITEALDIPTIGIGAGADCDGQILVWHDLLGLTPGHVPQFVKRYAELGVSAKAALEAYVTDVRSEVSPSRSTPTAWRRGRRRFFAEQARRATASLDRSGSGFRLQAPGKILERYSKVLLEPKA